MVEFTPTVVFLAILFSVPLQFYLSPKSSSDAQYYLYKFIDDVKHYYKYYFNGTPTGSPTDVADQSDPVLNEIIDEELLGSSEKGGKKNTRGDLFGGSDQPRNPRPPHIKYRVGQVIRHRIHNYRGVIVAWDETAKAPEWWIKRVHKDRKEWSEEPNYTILIDTRDRLVPQIAYIVEHNVILSTSTGAIVHPLVKHYFESFDGKCYKMRPWHKAIYPND